jgi:hypothetical protein
MILRGENRVWSTGGMILRGENRVWSTGGMILRGENRVWSTGGMIPRGENRVWSTGGMILRGQTRSTRRKFLPVSLFSHWLACDGKTNQPTRGLTKGDATWSV